MKKLLLITALLASGSALAGSDFSVTWDGRDLTLVSTVSLDLEIGQNFYQAHGSIDYVNGFSVPITGTCFGTNSGGAFCILALPRGMTGHARINPSDLSFSWETQNVNGTVLESARMPLVTVE